MSDLFYLQDSRDYVGNDILFWAKNEKGYTTDLNNAETYTKKEAVAQHNRRESDIPWPKDYVDSKTRPALDMQNAHIGEALKGTGVKLTEPTKKVKSHLRCYHCGIFLSEPDYYSASGCKKCGGSNHP